MKVYAHNKPSIVMEWSKGFAYFSGELEAFDSNGLVWVRRTLHGGELIEAWKPHNVFTDKDGNSFWNLQETIDGLNEIFNTDNNLTTTNIIDLDAHIVNVVSNNFNVNVSIL
jgi:hypothetical protein